MTFALLVAVLASGALLEFYWIAETAGARPMKPIGIALGLVLFVVVSMACGTLLSIPGVNPRVGGGDSGSVMVIAVLLVGNMATFVAGMFRVNARPLRDNLVTVSGIVYVSLSLTTLLVLRNMFPHDAHATRNLALPVTVIGNDLTGAYAVVGMMISIWTCDSVAYFVGRAIGRHRLFERISPKKSWEGAIAGCLGAVAVVLLMRESILPHLSIVDAVLLGLFSGVGGQLGDLAESHLKRDAGVKDSSQIIPGHGGLLDRFDSLLFVAPLWTVYHSIAIVPT